MTYQEDATVPRDEGAEILFQLTYIQHRITSQIFNIQCSGSELYDPER